MTTIRRPSTARQVVTLETDTHAPGGGPFTVGSSELNSSGATAGTYGDSTHVGQFTLGADGRISSATDVAIAFPGGTPGGTSGQVQYNNAGVFGGGDLSGDVATSGSLATTISTNAVTTPKIADSAVTYAKMQNASAASVLIGRGAGSGAGTLQEITLGTGLSMSGTTLSASGSGTVTSVGLSAPVQFNVTGSPVTTSGTLALAWTNQSANTVLAGPSSGAAAPTFRALAAGDLPAISSLLDGIGATQGDLLYRDASGWAVLPPGTAGNVLQTNGTAANPSWAAAGGLSPIADGALLANTSGASATPVATALTALLDHVLGNTRGGIIYRGASAWSFLAAGSANLFLKSQGASSDPVWASISSGLTTPTIRASHIQVGSGNSGFVTWPTGTVAGDIVVIFGGAAFQIFGPSGWTVYDTQNGTNTAGIVMAKQMTSGDITAGGVTVSMAGNFSFVFSSISIISPGDIRQTVAWRNQVSDASWTLNTSWTPVTTDLILCWGAARNNILPTCNYGSQQQQLNGTFSGVLNAGSPAANGTQFSTVTYPGGSGSGDYNAMFVIKAPQ